MLEIWVRKLVKNLNDKQKQKVIDHAKQSATDALKTFSKRVIEKATEATGGLIGNKIPDKTTRISKNSQQNISETVINQN